MNNVKAVREVRSMYKKFETDIENLCLEVDSIDACELIEEALHKVIVHTIMINGDLCSPVCLRQHRHKVIERLRFGKTLARKLQAVQEHMRRHRSDKLFHGLQGGLKYLRVCDKGLARILRDFEDALGLGKHLDKRPINMKTEERKQNDNDQSR